MEKPLALLKPLDNSQVVIINCSPFDIGRSRAASLILPHINVSRNHCQITHSKDHAWILEDLSSSGTFVNDELIGKGNSVLLNGDEIIRLGPKDCNFIWKFLIKTESNSQVKDLCSSINTHSQAIVEICNEKNSLQKRIILNKESYLKMKIKEQELQQQCLSQVNQSDDINNHTRNGVEGGMCKTEDGTEKELVDLQKKIIDNSKTEEELKLEIRKLQEKLVSEQIEWEKRFAEERRKLEGKIDEQNEKLAVEKSRIKEMSIANEQLLEDKLRKEEEEKKNLVEKLREMEQAKHMLSQKMKESDELHVLEMIRVEEEMKRGLMEKEEKIKTNFQEQINAFEERQRQTENEFKAKLENKERTKHQDLLEELDQVKSTLLETENKKKLLEKELAEISSIKDEVTKVKSSVLENIADLMESELQCSICSELLVIATTLNCTHTFCKYCIEMWKKKKKDCPICRKRITHENRSIVMDNYIDKMVENLSDEVKNRRKAVIAERNCDDLCKKSKLVPSSCEYSTLQQPMQNVSLIRGGNARGRNRNRNSRSARNTR